jgi:hydrogenase expression/formation protein HypE
MTRRAFLPPTERIITLGHGAGGRKSQRLISGLILKHLTNPVLDRLDDSSYLPRQTGKPAVTTDSFVVKPLRFSGGDIGRLSVCGTVNDLTAVGARPICLTVGLIIEEGFSMETLDMILSSLRKTCDEAGVFVAAGDTKVVGRGQADGLYINTTGFGVEASKTPISSSGAEPGDVIILSGYLGDHEIAILKERSGGSFQADIRSDCAPLNRMILPLLSAGHGIHAMRDPTRGGLASALNEIAAASKVDIRIDSEDIPVRRPVRTACEMFGFDPLNLANEGKMVLFCDPRKSGRILSGLTKHRYGKHAAVIGTVTGRTRSGTPRVIEVTDTGGERIVLIPEGELLPRIC